MASVPPFLCLRDHHPPGHPAMVQGPSSNCNQQVLPHAISHALFSLPCYSRVQVPSILQQPAQTLPPPQRLSELPQTQKHGPRGLCDNSFVGGWVSGPVAPIVFSLCSLQLRLPVAPFIVQSHLPQGVICSLGIKTRLYNFSGPAPWVGCTVQMLGEYLLIDESLYQSHLLVIKHCGVSVLGNCSFSQRRKKLVTVTILSPTLSLTFASLNGLEDRKACPQETSAHQMAAGAVGAPRV